MPDLPPYYSVRLADDIALQLGLLTQLLAHSSPQEAALILSKVLDYDEGLLGRVTELVATGSRFAQDHSQRGILPPEVWLAVGRSASEMGNIGAELGGHADTLKRLGAPSAIAPGKPVPSAMVVRRSR
ncbi:hypothetical protein OH768_47710 [Streptomyces sp. NBC_01622]|uniref:hypothetical protein n=1 Tax=Streptomyces sp. NBC_01622 TaxID=2975903 RepID=UPI00386FCC9C|nr:hypothetical protein OH768_47710 [Streptomyces sp. NBC_01622]